MRLRRGFLALVMALAVIGLPLESAWAQAWPGRAIRFIVPLPPGGAYDYIARLLADQLRPVLGVPLVVENKYGAGARIGTEYVARAAADGYTFLIIASTHVIVPSMVKKLPYDAIKDFEPVSLVVDTPFVLVVNPGVPARSARELISLARAKPGSIAYGSTGVGSPFHLAAELLKLMAGIDMLHVPYKGTGPLTQALLAGEVPTAFVPVGPYLQHIRSGKLRPLALGAGTRTSLLPDIPTIAEAVPLPGFGLDSWVGMVAPADTPRQIVERMSTEVSHIVREPQFGKERLLSQGYEPVGSTPGQFMEVMKKGLALYAKIVKDARIPPE